MELVTIVDIKRSLPNKKFSTQMSKLEFDRKKSEGKLKDWVLESDIVSISSEVVHDGSHDGVKVSFEDEADGYDLLSLSELKQLCKDRGIKFSPATKDEKKLIALLGK